MKVSFDFDGTLTQLKVKEFCKELIVLGHEVWICTMRYDDAHLAKTRHVYYDNIGLYATCDLLGIDRSRIIFCNETTKSPFLAPHNFVFHLDDDQTVLNEIAEKLPNLAIDVYQSDWLMRCVQALENAAV